MGTRSPIYFTSPGDVLKHVSPKSLMLFGLAWIRDRYHFGTLWIVMHLKASKQIKKKEKKKGKKKYINQSLSLFYSG